MNNAYDNIVYIEMLPNGTDLPRALCREFRRQVEDATRWLPPGVTCDIGDLVTPGFWLPLGERTRSKLGQFLAHWVAQGELRLEFVGPPRRPNKRFRLRQ
jgi:hypothetical protein